MTAIDARAPTLRPRLVLVFLFALFMFPIFGALFLNVVAPSWLPFGLVNHGELVDPPFRIESHLLALTERHAPGSGDAQSTWLIVHVSDTPCEPPCQQALVDMRQARLALGKDASRVERWWLMTREPDPRTVRWAEQAFPGLRLATLRPAGSLEPAPARLHVVDPAGYVVLRYRKEHSASDLLKDMKRLLKISKQG